MSIYVETQIQGTMEELWRLTQVPNLHEKWDLRFTRIEYLPRSNDTQPQRFLYATRIGFGLTIEGEGESVGQKDGPKGDRSSALKFWSKDPKSLIREGAGYWRYVSTKNGLRFLTSYDYRVRFGIVGKLLDTLLFRPLLSWATAWSFDRLRLWIEKQIDPAVSMQRSMIHLITRIALAFVWLYQGAIPKLVTQHADELTMLQQMGVSVANSTLILQAIGWMEVAFGIAMILWFHQGWHFLLTLILMLVATISVAINSPQFLGVTFNPISLNVLMIALALIGLLVSRDLPSASHCLRKQPKEEK